MTEASRHDAWQAGDAYDIYMGRWSRRIAPVFLDWLDVDEGLDWLEVGCGTGALSAAVVGRCNPRSLTAIDASAGFIATARASVPDPRVAFHVGDAQALPMASGTVDVAVSALVLNFVPDRSKAVSEMARASRSGATVAFYVWDYPGGGVEFMRAFWTAAKSLDRAAAELTEDRRFPFCNQADLTALAKGAGLASVDSIPIEAPSTFADFADLWRPFTLGAGPAPGYCMSLDRDRREKLRQRLHDSLPQGADGSISLKLRAWAVKGTV